MDALDRAIAVFGTQELFADALGIRSPSVSEWRSRGQIPLKRCKDIVRVTRGAVTFVDLRPDIADAVAANQPRKYRRKRA